MRFLVVCKNAGVAQQVEQVIRNDQVGGSIPLASLYIP